MKLKPIESKADYDAALTEIDGLMGVIPNTPGSDWLDRFVTVAEACEAKRRPLVSARTAALRLVEPRRRGGEPMQPNSSAP